MTDSRKVVAYLVGLVAVFALAWTVGNATEGEPAPPAEHSTHS